MNTPLNKPGSHYPEIRAQRKNMDPRLQNRQRFESKEHFPDSNGINQAGYQLWITPYALDAIQFLPSKQNRDEVKRKISELSSLPRALTHLQNRQVINVYKAPVGKYLIHYAINNGRVTVYDIDLNDNLLAAKNKLEKPALYHVKKTPGGWTTSGVTSASNVSTPYAAVNGQSNNLKKATWLMAEHLEYHHGKSFNEFSLFHNPTQGALSDTWESLKDKLQQTTEVSLAFSVVLKSVQAGQQNVNWLAHSQGAIIFCEAARVLMQQGINKLDKNKVIFDGGANNKTKTDPLMAKLGIECKHNSAPNDLVHHIAGGNATGLGQVLASAVHFTRIGYGTTESSSHTMAYKGDEQRKCSLQFGVKNPGIIKQGINTLAVKFWNT